MAHMIIQQICVICLENCYIPQFGFLDALSFLCLVSLPLLSAINTKVAWCHRMLCHCSAPNNKNKRRCTSKACRSCQTFPLFKTCRRPKTPNPDNSFFWLPWDFKSCKKMAHQRRNWNSMICEFHRSPHSRIGSSINIHSCHDPGIIIHES